VAPVFTAYTALNYGFHCKFSAYILMHEVAVTALAVGFLPISQVNLRSRYVALNTKRRHSHLSTYAHRDPQQKVVVGASTPAAPIGVIILLWLAASVAATGPFLMPSPCSSAYLTSSLTLDGGPPPPPSTIASLYYSRSSHPSSQPLFRLDWRA